MRDSGRYHPVIHEAALVARNRGLAYVIAADFYIPGADRDDVRQEAMIGLLVAIRTYDGSSPFPRFAALVIKRWLQTEMTRANRDKRRLLSEAVRVMRDPETHMPRPALDLIEDPYSDVVELSERRNDFARFVAAFDTLSQTERESLLLVYDGHEYAHRPDHKRIDNAVQRGRKKLREAA